MIKTKKVSLSAIASTMAIAGFVFLSFFSDYRTIIKKISRFPTDFTLWAGMTKIKKEKYGRE